ncbi:MAG: type II toxin-antitoxin system RelB/DinJ family antitoxin [Lactobacillales bacterium]|jgi:DNA-damage-inducible protein J|nr:type II toxin-antitoxin system RelB/DinJ family antitoxin [Lactobacillales bacterium]
MNTVDAQARISIRINADLKQQATEVLSKMQLDMTTAVNLFLDQVVKQNKLPFEITNEKYTERDLREIHKMILASDEDIKHGRVIDAREYFASSMVAEEDTPYE